MSLTNTSPTPRAAIYCRVSTKSQEDNYSLNSQEKNCRDYAERQGYVVADVYHEVASGFSLNRPKLTQLRDAVRRGEISTVVVNSFDRWASTDKDSYRLYSDLEAGHTALESVSQGKFDDSPTGRLIMMAYTLGREVWLEDHKERTKRGRREKAERGEVVGMGTPPYGYTYTSVLTPKGKRRVIGLEPDPLTAPVVVRIFDLLRHRSVADVAAMLNAESIQAPRHARWTPDTIYWMSRHAVYMGEWRYGRNHRHVKPDDAGIVVVSVPKIVSPDTWHDVQRALARRCTARRGRLTGDDDLYRLRSRLTCGHCGCAMHTSSDSSRTYRCGCRWPSRAAQRGIARCLLPDVHGSGIETELWRILSLTLLDPVFLSEGLATSLAAHQDADQRRAESLMTIDRQIAKLKRELDQLITDSLSDGIGLTANALIMKHVARIETTIATLSDERNDLLALRPAAGLSTDEAQALRAFAAEIRAGLDAASISQQRALIDLLDVRGTVYLDRECGVQLSRQRRNLFRIEWTARIPLLDSADQLKNLQ